MQPDAKDLRIAELEAEVVAGKARIAELEQQASLLTKKVEELTELLNRNSRNSHLPPSSDPPGKTGRDKGKGKGTGKGKRRRGGQKGHKGYYRQLLPPEQVDTFEDHFPPECENCWKPLPEIPDPNAYRHQHTEIPAITPHTTEHRFHEVSCPCCRYKTRSSMDKCDVPASPFGPRLMAIVALLTGVYHVSRRKAQLLLSDLLGVEISTGAVSKIEERVSSAVEPAVAEAWDVAQEGEVKHTDGTSWIQAGVALSLWTIATAMVTVFKIVTDSRKVTLKPLYGVLSGILVSDRAKALNFWAMERRQVCWAHLVRKFISFSERDGPAGKLGHELLECTGILFEYWHDFKSGKLGHEQLRAWMAPLRTQVEAILERAKATDIERLSGSCADILDHKQALWTFLDHEGVEPTNNHAERELRSFVLWRKRSFGTQSERGNLFAERLMTIAHTARKQNRHVLSFLTACCQAKLDETPAPSLFTSVAA